MSESVAVTRWAVRCPDCSQIATPVVVAYQKPEDSMAIVTMEDFLSGVVAHQKAWCPDCLQIINVHSNLLELLFEMFSDNPAGETVN